MFRLTRRAVIALSLAAPLALAACGESAPAPQPIPFTGAAVVGDGNGRYTLAWMAPEGTAVKVYAGTDPADIGRDKEVGAGGANGHIVAALPAGPRWYFEFTPENGATLVMGERGLFLESIPNLRDVGGYRADDGRWVKMGRLFRADQLDKVSDEDFAVFETLGLKLICDFRDARERAAGADRIPAGTELMIADVVGESGDGFGAVLGDLDATLAYLRETPGEDIMIEANRSFVSSASARAAYKATFERLADPAALPALFHCTAGKDRTGWGAAVLLTLLGVPEDLVMHDYLLSNRYLARKNGTLLAAFPSELAEAMMPLVGVKEEYLLAAFDEVQTTYGSFDAYIKDGLGLSDQTIAALKDNFLTPEIAP